MSPANLENPFGPSCCEGTTGACEEAHIAPRSAEPCGCDLGIGWVCANHKFKLAALELVKSWRERSVEFQNDELASTIFSECADALEEVL